MVIIENFQYSLGLSATKKTLKKLQKKHQNNLKQTSEHEKSQ